MTVIELKGIIQDLPDHMDIFMGERLTEFGYGLVNTARVKEIDMVEDVGGDVLATDLCLVLTED